MRILLLLASEGLSAASGCRAGALKAGPPSLPLEKRCLCEAASLPGTEMECGHFRSSYEDCDLVLLR